MLTHILREFSITLSIFGIVIIHAMFVKVNFRVIAGLKLKKIKIQILHHIGLDELVASLAGVSDVGDHLTLFPKLEVFCFGRGCVFHSISWYYAI